mmetsp:Transcript_8699/g.15759  ORF Transcript_8699/g.15759 Transcript_8699/m.15759 type:complete len:95 (+) Transcript_8699:1194-1478(+)
MLAKSALVMALLVATPEPPAYFQCRIDCILALFKIVSRGTVHLNATAKSRTLMAPIRHIRVIKWIFEVLFTSSFTIRLEETGMKVRKVEGRESL